MINTVIVSGFSGVGKTYLYKKSKLKVLDSDSSKFDKAFFPKNYIDHIKANLGKVDIILVSSHKEVRDALVDECLDFTLVYPSLHLKKEYISRYKRRGSDVFFINLINKNWNEWINELGSQDNCSKVILSENQFLIDVI